MSKATNPRRQMIIQAALNRAENGASEANYEAIFDGFEQKGIDLEDIHPRENVFTYNAWQAKGRQVMRGEKGVRIVTMIPDRKRPGKMRPWRASVFHVSQTKAVGDDAPKRRPRLDVAPEPRRMARSLREQEATFEPVPVDLAPEVELPF